MPTFTRKLSDLLEEGFDLGLTPLDYPIFDETYREPLNKKILAHYWNYEIGHETESMFRFSLNRKMNEIMPLYNQLYLSTRIEFDPLRTVKLDDVTDTTSHTAGSIDETTHAETESTNQSDSRARNVNSTTPQVMLSTDEDYASSASNSVSDANGNTTGSNDGTNNTTTANDSTGNTSRHIEGSQGIASELLLRFRSTFLNIDMQVITELRELFMQVWDNGDEYSMNGGLLNVYPGGSWLWY